MRVPLFDLGNVIIRVDFEPFLQWLAEKSKDQDPTKARALLSSSLFYDFEFGNISRQGFARRLGALYGAQIEVPELEEKFCTIFPGMVEGMGELLEELAAEGPVYCLSNTNEIHLEYVRQAFPVVGRFTRIFASHEIHKRKPYPGIYRDVASSLGLDPRDLVFFDDVHGNVQGAIRAGLEAHLFSTAAEARLVLKNSKDTDDRENGGEFP